MHRNDKDKFSIVITSLEKDIRIVEAYIDDLNHICTFSFLSWVMST